METVPQWPPEKAFPGTVFPAKPKLNRRLRTGGAASPAPKTT
jgi:hypothetical protein